MGEAPESIVLVQSPEEAETVELPDTPLAYITQTTLSVDETNEVIEVLRRRFPRIEAPKKEDICYATTNRQRAVKAMLPAIDLLLVIGSQQLELQPPRRGRPCLRRPVVPDRRRDGDRGGLARRRRDARGDLRGFGARAARRPCPRLVRGRGVDDVSAFTEETEDVTFKLPADPRASVA